MTGTLLGEWAERRTAVNNRGQRKYSRTFKIESDATSDTAFDIGSVAGLPVLGDAFPDDANAYCKQISVSCQAGYKYWTVQCDYDDLYDNAGSTPANDETQISWSSELFQRPAWKDKDGNGVVNSAGDPFNPPVMRDDHRLVCRIVKNAATAQSYILSYINVVNSVAFTIDGLSIGQRYAKISNVSVSEERRRNGTVFRQHTIEMQIRNNEWDFEIMDVGFQQIDPNDATKRIKCKDDEGVDVTEPALLNGSGSQVADPDETGAAFLPFRVYTELNYIGTIPGCS